MGTPFCQENAVRVAQRKKKRHFFEPFFLSQKSAVAAAKQRKKQKSWGGNNSAGMFLFNHHVFGTDVRGLGAALGSLMVVSHLPCGNRCYYPHLPAADGRE